MNVIDTEKVHVFNVPGKGSPPHAKVQVRQVYAGEALRRKRQDA